MWFKRKVTWEKAYAQNIYDGLVAHNDFSGITALTLQIPTILFREYEDKILQQRELICFFALMEAARPDTRLPPVVNAFGDLLVSKANARGLKVNRDQLADHAISDASGMINSPSPWAQRWLAQFRNDPNDNYGVALFADHCLRLYAAYKTGIENTRPK
jgi:hypothetical protein